MTVLLILNQSGLEVCTFKLKGLQAHFVSFHILCRGLQNCQCPNISGPNCKYLLIQCFCKSDIRSSRPWPHVTPSGLSDCAIIWIYFTSLSLFLLCARQSKFVHPVRHRGLPIQKKRAAGRQWRGRNLGSQPQLLPWVIQSVLSLPTCSSAEELLWWSLLISLHRPPLLKFSKPLLCTSFLSLLFMLSIFALGIVRFFHCSCFSCKRKKVFLLQVCRQQLVGFVCLFMFGDDQL